MSVGTGHKDWTCLVGGVLEHAPWCGVFIFFGKRFIILFVQSLHRCTAGNHRFSRTAGMRQIHIQILTFFLGFQVASGVYKKWDDSDNGFRPISGEPRGLVRTDDECKRWRWSAKQDNTYCSNYQTQIPGDTTEQQCLDACTKDCTAVSYHPDVEFCYIVHGVCNHRRHESFFTYSKEPACDDESEALQGSRTLAKELVSASQSIKNRFKALTRRNNKENSEADAEKLKQDKKCEPNFPVWNTKAAGIACGDRIMFHSGPSNPGGALSLHEAKLLVAQEFPSQCGLCAGESYLQMCRTALQGCVMCRPIFNGANLTCLWCAGDLEPVGGRCDGSGEQHLFRQQYIPPPKTKVTGFASRELPRAGKLRRSRKKHVRTISRRVSGEPLPEGFAVSSDTVWAAVEALDKSGNGPHEQIPAVPLASASTGDVGLVKPISAQDDAQMGTLSPDPQVKGSTVGRAQTDFTNRPPLGSNTVINKQHTPGKRRLEVHEQDENEPLEGTGSSEKPELGRDMKQKNSAENHDSNHVDGVVEVDNCASAPCESGTCIDFGADAFRCECEEGWKGVLCDREDILEPELQETAPRSISTNLPHSTPGTELLRGADWQQAQTPDGRTYFYDTATMETSWQNPLIQTGTTLGDENQTPELTESAKILTQPTVTARSTVRVSTDNHTRNIGEAQTETSTIARAEAAKMPKSSDANEPNSSLKQQPVRPDESVPNPKASTTSSANGGKIPTRPNGNENERKQRKLEAKYVSRGYDDATAARLAEADMAAEAEAAANNPVGKKLSRAEKMALMKQQAQEKADRAAVAEAEQAAAAEKEQVKQQCIDELEQLTRTTTTAVGSSALEAKLVACAEAGVPADSISVLSAKALNSRLLAEAAAQAASDDATVGMTPEQVEEYRRAKAKKEAKRKMRRKAAARREQQLEESEKRMANGPSAEELEEQQRKAEEAQRQALKRTVAFTKHACCIDLDCVKMRVAKAQD